MDSLDCIWDEPVEQLVEDGTPRTSSLRTQDPLFLAGSDDDDAPRHPPQNAPEVDVDIDAMFADVENDDDPFSFKPLTSKLDTEVLQREAEARHKRNMPSLTPHIILSSSPQKDMGHGDEGFKSRPTGGEQEGTKKEKRKPVQLDEGRLLGPTGFPKLIKDMKNFRTKGKGHEATDLNRLLQVYNYWTHEMYPKTTFRDTVERVEKLCHTKRMHVALSVWRDEAHGLVNGRKSEDESEIIDLTENPERDLGIAHNGSSRASSPVSDGAAYASSSSHPPSRPPSSGTEMEDDDDFDIDAIIRDEEERVARERAASEASHTTAKEKGNLIDDDEDMAMWEALNATQINKSHAAQPTTTILRIEEEDNTMWNELVSLQESASSASALAKSSAQDLNEDEDMWDVVHEMESNATAANEPCTAPRIEPLEVSPAATTSRQDDDDWDSVYV